MDSIRLCYFIDGKESDFVRLDQSIRENEILTSKPTFLGYFKQLLDDFAELYYLPNFNYTIQSQRSIGRQVSPGIFDGCNGLMQRNQTDAGLYVYYYPSYHPDID